MTKADKNRVQELTKELRGLIIPNHQYKKWELKENLTKEQLINLEKLLVKEIRKTRTGHSKEIKKALFTLYPILHPCCLLREVRGRIGERAITWQEKLKKAEYLTKLVEKEVEEAEQLRTKEAISLLFNNPQKFFKDDRKKF